jgi:hypothetical protein
VNVRIVGEWKNPFCSNFFRTPNGLALLAGLTLSERPPPLKALFACFHSTRWLETE